MKASIRTAFVLLAAAALTIGVFSAVAMAGKKKKTTVVVNAGSVLSGQKNVKVRGSLNTATACRNGRSMRLFLTDQNGVIQSTLDSSTSDSGGNWKLHATLASPPTTNQFLQVKAKKLTVGKFVCQAGHSGLIAIK
jgi:hypothetical protein